MSPANRPGSYYVVNQGSQILTWSLPEFFIFVVLACFVGWFIWQKIK